jgi:gamma-glutamyl-gamma-aminobutyrate hydrolase PuuD
MAKVRIGISTSPSVHDGVAVEGVNRSYVDAVRRAGATPLVLPVVDPADVEDLAGAVDGIVLSGGVDVEPSRYGAERAPEVEHIDPARDAFELALVHAAADLDLPVLGVCRGMQLLNVAHGGTLIQHLPGADAEAGHRERVRVAEVIHDVLVRPGSLLHDIVGSDRVGVNTLHHQAIDEIGAGLVPVAWSADDGIIEAVEAVGTRRLLGVQWHPELLEHLPGNEELFAWLVNECRHQAASSARAMPAPTSGTPRSARPIRGS